MATSNPISPDLKIRDDTSSSQEIKELQARPLRIWNIGDTGAGTVFFGRDNLLGFSNVLRDEISHGNIPDLLVFHGGLISDIPEFGTRGYRSKALILEQSIESVDKSVIAVKPYLTRITDQLERHRLDTQIVYVLGPNDIENIKREADLVLQMYDKVPTALVTATDQYRAKVDKIQDGIDDTRLNIEKQKPQLAALQEKLEKEEKELEKKAAELKSHDSKDTPSYYELRREVRGLKKKVKDDRKGISNYNRRINGAQEKIAEDSDELGDYKAVYESYRYILARWIKDPSRTVEEVMRKLGGNEAMLETPWLLDLIAEARGPHAVTLMTDELKAEKLSLEATITKLSHSMYVLRGREKAQEKKEKKADKENPTQQDEKKGELAKKLHQLRSEDIQKKLSETREELVRVDTLLDKTIPDLKKRVDSNADTEVVTQLLKKRMLEIRNAIKRADPKKDRKRILELQDEQKSISNKLRKQTYEELDVMKGKAEREAERWIAGGLEFTNLRPAPPEVTKRAQQIAIVTITANLRDAFGRRTSVTLVPDIVGTVGVRGLVVNVANKLDPASYILSDSEIPIRGFLAANSRKKVDFLLLAGSPNGLELPCPKLNGSDDIVYVLDSPPAVNLAALGDIANSRAKTWITSILKHNPSSGIDEIVYDGLIYDHKFHTSSQLELRADIEKEMEAIILAKEIRKLASSGIHLPLVLDERDEITTRNAMPSKLRKKPGGILGLLTLAGVDVTNREQLRELANRIEQDPAKWNFSYTSRDMEKALGWLAWYTLGSGRERVQRSQLFSIQADAHFGSTGIGISNFQMTRALTAYLYDNYENIGIRVSVGDNIEASHKDLKNEVNEHNTRTNIAGFEKYLKEHGIQESDPKHNILMAEYGLHLLEKQAVINIDDQKILYANAVRTLTLLSTATFYVSGNHFNKSQPKRDQTEAVNLAEAERAGLFQVLVEALWDQKKAEELRTTPLFSSDHKGENLHEFRNDSDYGQGVFQLGEDGPLIRTVHKAIASQVVNNLRPAESAVLTGDKHHHRVKIVANIPVIIGLPLRAEDAYPNLLNIPTSPALRGMSFFKLTYDTKNKSLEYEDWFVWKKPLEKYLKVNPVIEAYEKSREVPKSTAPEAQPLSGMLRNGGTTKLKSTA